MSKNEVGFAVTDEYKSWIDDIKKRIRQAQIKAAIKVNYELLDLYWARTSSKSRRVQNGVMLSLKR